MNRWMVLLRGVNVGRHRQVPMKRLVDVLLEAGFESVRTYIQSGNVVLDSHDQRASVGVAVRSLIQAEFGFDVATVVRTHAEIAAAARHPLDTGRIDPKLLHVVFLVAPASLAQQEQLNACAPKYSPDHWSISESGDTLFVAYPNGSATSRLTLDVIERHLGVVGTARNLNTVRRLVDFAPTHQRQD